MSTNTNVSNHKTRARNFCFTHNNYQNTDIEDALECKYIIYGKEVGASGTPHLQGFVSFDNASTLGSVIKKLPGCHVEIAIAPESAIEYCKKDGDYTERGTPFVTKKEKAKKCGDAEKLRWAEAIQLAKEGKFDEIQPELYTRYRRTYQQIHEESRPEPETINGEMEHEWLYGPAGCGKSSTARNENPGAYIKDLTKWWDNYDHQEVAIIDDVDKYDVKFARMLKLWCDRYPFQAESKGKQQLIRPRKIVITSQYHPNEIWDDEKTQEALDRRVKIRSMGGRLVRTDNPVASCFACHMNETKKRKRDETESEDEDNDDTPDLC